MDPSSTLPAPHPHLSRDEKRRLFEEQKQRRLERFSSVAPFGDRMEKIEDVEQIQDKVYELHLQGSPNTAPLPSTKRRSHMHMEEEDEDQQASATNKRSRVATHSHTGECSTSSFILSEPSLCNTSRISSRSSSNTRVIAPHPQAPPPLPPPPASSSFSSSSSTSVGWQHKALWLEHRAQAEQGTTNTKPYDGHEKEEGSGMVMTAMEEEGLGGSSAEGEDWAPLPPRQRDRRRGRSRASSIEMMTS